jgi:general secretion pathway protein G
MKTARAIQIVAFWMGVTLFILGQVISFYPGAETGWFAVSAGLCLCGFLVPNRSYRIAALFLVIFGIAISISGYRRGEQYRVAQSKRPSTAGRMKENAARAEIKSFDQALTIFHNDTGRYPTTEEGLSSLVTNLDISGWKGPYLNPESIPPDPWGTPYRYSLVDGSPRIVSAGRDKQFGTSDDLLN